MLTLIAHREGEDGGFIYRHITALMHVDIQPLVLQIECTVAEWNLRLIEMRRVRFLPWTATGTAVEVIDERTVFITQRILLYKFERGVCVMIETVILQCTIHAHVHISELIRTERKACFLGMTLAIRRITMVVQIQNWR